MDDAGKKSNKPGNQRPKGVNFVSVSVPYAILDYIKPGRTGRRGEQ